MTDTIEAEQVNSNTSFKPFQLGRIISRTFSAIKHNIKPLLLAIILIWAFQFLVSLILLLPLSLAGDNQNVATGGIILMSVIRIILALFFLMLISAFADILAYSKFTNNPVGFKMALKRAAKASFPLLLICAIYFIAMQIGTLLLIIPGIIIALGWAIIGPVYLHEDTPLFGTFGRAWHLSSGYKLWIWLAKIVMSLIFLAILMIPIILYFSIAAAASGSGGSKAIISFGAILSQIFLSISTYGFYILYASFTAALYTELVELKEGSILNKNTVFD